MKKEMLMEDLKLLCEMGNSFLEKYESKLIEYMLTGEESAENSLQSEILLELLDHVRGICRIQDYCNKKIVKNGTLTRNKDGKIMLDGEELSLMTELEVYVYDELKESFCWTRTFVGGAEKVYLVGLGKDYELNGLPARIRG